MPRNKGEFDRAAGDQSDVDRQREELDDVGGDGGGSVGAKEDGRSREQPALTKKQALPGNSDEGYGEEGTDIDDTDRVKRH